MGRRPATEELPDFALEVLGEDFAKKILNTPRAPWNAKVSVGVLGFIDLLAALASGYLGRRIYRNDVVERAFAYFAAHPDVLDDFLAETWGFGILPEEEEEPALEFELDEEGTLKPRG